MILLTPAPDTTPRPGKALYDCIMDALRERDTLEKEIRWTRAEMNRKAAAMDLLPSMIKAAIENPTA